MKEINIIPVDRLAGPPEIKKSGTEQIKQKAKESIYSRIARARATVEQQNRERNMHHMSVHNNDPTL